MTHSFPKRRLSDLYRPEDPVPERREGGAPRRDDRLPIIIHDDVRGMSQLPPTRRSSAASAATRQCRTRFRIPTEPWDEKADDAWTGPSEPRSEEHTSELQSLMRLPYADFCL